MWLLTVFSLLILSGISPTLSVGSADGSLPGHPTEPEGVAQNAWYPGVSLLGPVDGTSPNPLITPRPDSAVGTVERVSAGLELEVWCIADLLTLSVGATLNGVELDPEALTLGNGCKISGMSADHLWFAYDLSLCGTQKSVVNGNVVFTNFLQYTPDPANVIPEQVDFFALPVHCTLDRFQDQSPVVMSLPVSPKSSDPGFALKTMNGSWAAVAETNVYRRGQPVYLQAAVGGLEDEQQLYVQSCHATASPDPRSRPRVRLIVKKGCVVYVVSKRGRAKFVLSEQTDAVNFVFAAFHFTSPEIYIHCELAILEQKMTSASKFCNYNQKKQRWEELSGNIAVCSCCRTVCEGPTPGSMPPGLQALVTIGPLVVNRTTVGDSKPETSPPMPSETPVAMETTSPPLPFLPAAFPEVSYPGYAEVAAQDWAELPAESLPYLDGMPVVQGVWGQPYAPSQGWLAAGVSSAQVTWVYPPVVANGGVLLVRHVPEEPGMDVVVEYVPVDTVMEASWQNEASGKVEDSFASLQSDDGDVLQRYHRDDPSAQDDWGQGFVGNGLFSDPILEESRRKRWGGNLGALIQEGNRPEQSANQKEDPDRHGDENALGEVALDDEGLVVQKSEVVMHKEPGQVDLAVLSSFRSRLALTRSKGAAQKLHYEEVEQGLGEEDRAVKRRVLLEEDNVRPSSLRAVLRRMYKAE